MRKKIWSAIAQTRAHHEHHDNSASVTAVIISSRVQLMRRDSHHSMAQYITMGMTISNGVRDIVSARN